MTRRRLLWALLILVILGDLGIGGYYALNKTLSRRFQHNLAVQGLTPIRMTGFRLFYDGIVIQSLVLSGQMDLQKIYLQGHVWDLWRGQPAYIHVDMAKIGIADILAKPVWPFAIVPLSVDKVTFTTELLGQSVNFSGAAKQSRDTPLVLDFKSDTEKLLVTGRAEVKFKGQTLNSIDISFDDIEADLPSIQARRAGGWVTLNHDAEWSMLGEMESGSLVIDNEPLLDAAVKLNGSLASPAGNMTGREQADPAVWSFDLQNQGLTIHRDGQSAFMRWQKLDNAVLADIALLMQSLKDPPPDEEPPMPE